MAEVIITKDNFETEVLRSDIPVFIDFWASWCGPCRMLAPIVAEIAQEYAGSVKVCKVNVDEQPELAQLFGIESIPTVVLVQNRRTLTGFLGAQSKETLTDMIRGYLREE